LGDELAKKGGSNAESEKVKKKSSTTDAVGPKEVSRLVDARIEELRKKGMLGKGGPAD
jgi:hypothetical protein|tara:strand:+ start:1376 stop:1549 length:174 start_codon:yes stop_codon:yes gene_type:complete